MKLKTYQMAENLEEFHPGGHEELLRIAQENSEEGLPHTGLHETSREDVSKGPVSLPFATVPPDVLTELAPWLNDWYRGPLLESARDFVREEVEVVASENSGNFPLINIHRGWNPELGAGESYESHVDSNSPTGLYFLGQRDRTPDTGGALVISREGDVPTRADVLRHCDRYYPKVGELAIMEGYGITHFVEPSTDGQDRIMLVCNFWTPEAPESRRAAGLADGYDIGRVVDSQSSS